jgi:nitrate reductase beta subunit
VDLRLSESVQRPEGADQPTAEPISMIDGEKIDVQAGPNWDDDLGGSPIYAANDPNLEGLTEEQRLQLSSVERLVFFYLPRICNHCLNPCCVASCPSGALYKRGEDGIVLIDQQKCRAWRSCVAACPYKKTYFNWFTGKSEKCILCFPRLETGRPRRAFIRVSEASDIWACCCTTLIDWKKLRSCRMTNSSKAKDR